MQSLIKMLKAYLKKLASDLHAIIFVSILGALGITGAVIRLFFSNAWKLLKNAMILPTPLWVTVTMVLGLLAYIYLKSQSLKTSLKNETTLLNLKALAKETGNLFLISMIDVKMK